MRHQRLRGQEKQLQASKTLTPKRRHGMNEVGQANIMAVKICEVGLHTKYTERMQNQIVQRQDKNTHISLHRAKPHGRPLLLHGCTWQLPYSGNQRGCQLKSNTVNPGYNEPFCILVNGSLYPWIRFKGRDFT